MRARKLDHVDVLNGHLRGPGPFSASFANGAFANCEEALAAEGGLQDCDVAPSRVAVILDVPADTATLPTPPVFVVVPSAGGLLCTTLAELRGGPRHFVAAAPSSWTWSNRRTAYRVALRQPSRAEQDGRPLRAVLLDVSIGGGRMELSLPQEQVEPGMRLRIELPVVGGPWVDAEVVRVDSARETDCTCGVRWLDLPANIDQRLANFVFSRERGAAKHAKPARPPMRLS